MIPIHNRLILRPSDSAARGMIFIPDIYRDAATSCLVIAAGEKVNPLIKPGDVVFCQVGLGSRNAGMFEGTRDFLCRDSDVYAVIRNRKIFPFGRKVLIRRDIADEYHGSIVVPANRRYQSLFGTVERLAISREPFKTIGIRPGMKIRLTEWMEHFVEVELEDGAFGLIVNEQDLLCEIN